VKACWARVPSALLLKCLKEVFVAKMGLHACFALMLMLFLTGCFNTLEQRWQAFDADRTAEIGMKTKDYYITEWGKPAKRARLEDGGEIITWTFSGYGGNQGWRKTLTFTPDGILKSFERDYWPKEQ
jgi:hypothetical protein